MTAPIVGATLSDAFVGLEQVIIVSRYNTETQLGVALLNIVDYTVTMTL